MVLDKLFDKEIASFSKFMKSRLIEKQEKYGDKWKTMSFDDLRERIRYLYDLFEKSIFIDVEKKKLVDLANQCMLLFLRIIKEEE